MENCCVNTPLGKALITGDVNGIRSIKLVEEDSELTHEIPKNLKECCTQLSDYFSGKRKHFDFKINPQGTDFQKKVWKHLTNIPFGKTTTYLELSRELGDEKAIRAVAAANGKNPLWIVVPCHRVIGSDGSLVGYAGGLSRKAWLLNHEQNSKQQSLF